VSGRDRGFEIAGVDQLAADLDVMQRSGPQVADLRSLLSRPYVLQPGQDAYTPGLRQARRYLGEVVANLRACCSFVEAGVLAGLVYPVFAER